MQKEFDCVTSHIGSDDGKTWKAYFYWKVGGETVDSKEFNKAELGAEIKRRKALGEDVSIFENEYAKL